MKPKLIKTLDEVQEHVAVSMTSAINVINPYLYSAERTYIKDLIGSEQFTALVEAYAEMTDPDAELTVIPEGVKLAQRVISNLGYLIGVPILSVSIGSGGIQINSSENTKNAFQWQTEDVKDSLQELGFTALEEFLAHLEEHPDEFEQYHESAEYLAQKSTLIRSASDFTRYYDINGSRYIFQRILSIITRVESQTMVRVLGADFYESLKADGLTGKKKILVDQYLKPGLALLSVSKALVERIVTLEGGKVAFNFRGNYNNIKESMPASRDQLKEIREQLDNDGNNFISTGMEYLSANPQDFEDFAPPVGRRRAKFNNDPDKGIFGV